MENHIVKIISVEPVTHDVKRFTVKKPEHYNYTPGQATMVSINSQALKNEKRPFTFTGLNENQNLEFTIKIYDDQDSVTKALGGLKHGDEIILHEIWGAIHYKGNGVFIAGGAGVTPFIAILRQLEQDKHIDDNMLIFSNKTERDIILRKEFEKMMGNNFINILSKEKHSGYDSGQIDKNYLIDNITDFDQYFYVCGPPTFVKDISKSLIALGVDEDKLVLEKMK